MTPGPAADAPPRERPDRFHVGGSLPAGAPTYVLRPADAALARALRARQACAVFDARQMGKSSLQIRARRDLEAEGYRCASLDLNRLGAAGTTPELWFGGFFAELVRGFRLDRQVDAAGRWRDLAHLPPVLRLDTLLRDALRADGPTAPRILFIDEIDAALNTPFPPDDFVAWIRTLADPGQRDDAAPVVVLMGTILPSELVTRSDRTPFNLGEAIALEPLELEACAPLAAGFAELPGDPRDWLSAILDWSGGQPFLTQKLCRLVLAEAEGGRTSGDPAGRVADTVRRSILLDWAGQDDPIHLRTIQRRLLHRVERVGARLGLYEEILKQGEVSVEGRDEEQELLISGLVIRRDGRLRVRNRIYREIFDAAWVRETLHAQRPWGVAFAAWRASDESDVSRLLRGEALREARAWARGRHLAEPDHRFLAASEEEERQERERQLLAERAGEALARLHAEELRGAEQRRYVTRLRALLGGLGVVLLALLVVGGVLYRQTHRLKRSEKRAQLESAESAQVTAFLQETFGAADPTLSHGATEQAKELLDRAAARLDRELEDQPTLRARLRSSLGEIYQRRAEFAAARRLLDLAVSAQETGGSPDDLALTLYRRGTLDLEEREQGREDLERALALRERHFGPDHPETIRVVDRLGVLASRQGHSEEAETHFRRALAANRRHYGRDHIETARMLTNLAGVHYSRDQFAEALRLEREAQSIFDQALAPDDIRRVNNLEALGLTLHDMNRPAEALPLLESARLHVVQRFGATHPRVAATLNRLALVELALGHLSRADSLARAALTIREATVDPANPVLAHSLQTLAEIALADHRPADALPLLDRATTLRSTLSPDHPDRRRTASTLARAQSLLKQP